jgi:hypothetical protein
VSRTKPSEARYRALELRGLYATFSAMDLPASDACSELVRRYARLLANFAPELGERPMVLPNADFFPDPFRADEASVLRLVRRLSKHAGMSDIPIGVQLITTGEGGAAGGACGTGSCGTSSCGSANAAEPELPVARVSEQEGGWRLSVFDVELAHPSLLTTRLVRALAGVFLAETSHAEAPVEPPLTVSLDLTAVALGFGALMLEGSHVYQKSCGGPSVTQLTTLSVGELAIAFALFIERGDHKTRTALRGLGATQQELLSKACAWARSNRTQLGLLRSAPAALLDAHFDFQPARPWLARLIGARSNPDAIVAPGLEAALAAASLDAALANAPEMLPTPTAPRPVRVDPRRAELRLLVDEALRAR